MTSLSPKISAVAPEPAKTYPKLPEAAPTPSQEQRTSERHPAFQSLSSSDVAYVRSLMGLLPAQKMDEVLLRTGVPMPANLGLDVDTSA